MKKTLLECNDTGAVYVAYGVRAVRQKGLMAGSSISSGSLHVRPMVVHRTCRRALAGDVHGRCHERSTKAKTKKATGGTNAYIYRGGVREGTGQ